MTHLIEMNGYNITWTWKGDGSNQITWCTPDNLGKLELDWKAPDTIPQDLVDALHAEGHIPTNEIPEEEELEMFYNDPADNPAIDFHGDFDAMSDDTQFKILNPDHYKIFPSGTYHGGIEYTDLCVALFEKNGLDSYTNHLIGQALKYLTRVGQKDAASQDLGKAAWYLDEAKSFLTKEGRYSEDNFTPINNTNTGR